MKAFIVLTVCFTAALAVEQNEYCYRSVNSACEDNKRVPQDIACDAKYGGIDKALEPLQKFVNHNFIQSFKFLLMSIHFSTYKMNRPGFEKLFRGLSDDTWEDSLELIQYMAKRGAEPNFNVGFRVNDNGFNPEMYEFRAVAKALDMQKKLALETHDVHLHISKPEKQAHDPEIASHLEREFMHKHRDIIRKLSGYSNDLEKILQGHDSSLSLYLFDEYLQKE